jgi:hypothetical protein
MAEGQPSDRDELERLRAELASLRAQLERSTVTAHGGSQIAVDGGVAGGQVAIGGDVQGDVIVAMDASRLLGQLGAKRPPPDLTQATGAYLDYLVDYYRCLDLRGMGISDRVPLRLPLLDMYVPLKARREAPPGETLDRELRLAGRRPGSEEMEGMGRRLGEPRGGSYVSGSGDARCALRRWVAPGYRDLGSGFRVLLFPFSPGL